MNYISFVGIETINLDEILDLVCNHLNLDKKNVVSKSRKNELVIARVVYCAYANESTHKKNVEIGDLINRDRNSVLHSINSAKNEYKYYNNYQEFKNALTKKNKT